jgi:hypothetical protein
MTATPLEKADLQIGPMEIFLKFAYRMLESNVRFGEILHFLRRCLRPPTLEMSRSKHE